MTRTFVDFSLLVDVEDEPRMTDAESECGHEYRPMRVGASQQMVMKAIKAQIGKRNMLQRCNSHSFQSNEQTFPFHQRATIAITQLVDPECAPREDHHDR